MKRAAPLDALTVLTTKGPLATKRIIAVQDGEPKIESYGKAQRFSFDEWDVSSFDEMAAALKALQRRERSFVVRGKPAEGIKRMRRTARAASTRAAREPATLIPSAAALAAVRYGFRRSARRASTRFSSPMPSSSMSSSYCPKNFTASRSSGAFTSGHGIKPGIRIRLWFWLDRPVSDAEIKLWLAPPIAEKLIDPALYYAGCRRSTPPTPIFVGMPDPVPYRCGVWRGHSDAVEVPAIETPQRRHARRPQHGGNSRGDGGGYEAHRAQIGDMTAATGSSGR